MRIPLEVPDAGMKSHLSRRWGKKEQSLEYGSQHYFLKEDGVRIRGQKLGKDFTTLNRITEPTNVPASDRESSITLPTSDKIGVRTLPGSVRTREWTLRNMGAIAADDVLQGNWNY